MAKSRELFDLILACVVVILAMPVMLAWRKDLDDSENDDDHW
jgi:hypothetical protein